MSSRPPPLDSNLDALLDAERDAPAPDDALARVLARVSVASGAAGSVATGPRSGRAPSPKVVGSYGLTILLATLVVGAASGAALHAVLRPTPPARVVFVDRPSSRAAPPALVAPPLAAPAQSATEREEVVEPRPALPTPARLARPRVMALPLSEERGLLDEARTALSEGDGAHALALTDEYTRRYAKPRLVEEREAIAIQALVLAGRYADARDRAARFEAASPDSLFRPAVEATLGSIP